MLTAREAHKPSRSQLDSNNARPARLNSAVVSSPIAIRPKASSGFVLRFYSVLVFWWASPQPPATGFTSHSQNSVYAIGQMIWRISVSPTR
jgi:hypothetical protein